MARKQDESNSLQGWSRIIGELRETETKTNDAATFIKDAKNLAKDNEIQVNIHFSKDIFIIRITSEDGNVMEELDLDVETFHYGHREFIEFLKSAVEDMSAPYED